MTPLEYEDRYHKLTVSLDGFGTTTVDVHRYQNNDAKLKNNEFHGNREALKHKDQLVGKLDAEVRQQRRAAGAKPKPEDIKAAVDAMVGPTDSLEREVGAERAKELLAPERAAAAQIVSAQRAVASMVHLNIAEVLHRFRPTLMTVHSGKGSPEQIAQALYLVSKYKLYDKKFASDPAAGIRDYCDRYIGLDCNGFVGNYARATGRGKTPDTPIRSFAPKTALRTRIEEVQPDDVLVWPDYGHINIIDSIGPLSTGPDGKPARDCVIVESTASNPSKGDRTANGGLQNSTYSIRSVGKDHLFLVERPRGGKQVQVYIAPLT